jgi:hypothetical protein
MTAEIGAEFIRGSLHRADARTRFDDQQQSSRKDEGGEYVIETKEKSTAPQATSTQAAEMGEASVGSASRDEEIRRRAYEIYLQRGEQLGHALDDWLQAERDLEGGVLSLAQAG